MKNPLNQAAFRHKLLELAERLQQGMPALKSEALKSVGGEAGGGLSNVPLHPADMASALTEEEVSMSMLETESHLAVEISEALARLDQGTFGRCERCGQDIARPRLEVMPYARFCLGCARAVEKVRPGS